MLAHLLCNCTGVSTLNLLQMLARRRSASWLHNVISPIEWSDLNVNAWAASAPALAEVGKPPARTAE